MCNCSEPQDVPMITIPQKHHEELQQKAKIHDAIIDTIGKMYNASEQK
jgi:hypothetical protein